MYSGDFGTAGGKGKAVFGLVKHSNEIFRTVELSSYYLSWDGDGPFVSK